MKICITKGKILENIRPLALNNTVGDFKFLLYAYVFRKWVSVNDLRKANTTMPF